MAAREYVAVSDAGLWSTSSTSSAPYPAVTGSGFTISSPGDNAAWAILVSFRIRSSSSFGIPIVQLYDTTNAASIWIDQWYGYDSSAFRSVGFIDIVTFGTAPPSTSYELRANSSSTSYTTYIDNLNIIAIKLTANDQYAQGGSSTTGTAYVNCAVKTWTPASAGDYLILGSLAVDGTGGSRNGGARILAGGAGYGEVLDAQRGSEAPLYFQGVKVNLTAVSQTIAVQVRALTSGFRAYGNNGAILALRLDDFDKSYYAEDRTGASYSTDTTNQDANSLTAITENKAHLILGGMQIGTSSVAGETYARPLEDGVQLQAETVCSPFDATGLQNQLFWLRILTPTAASHTWKHQFRTTNVSYTADWDEGWIAALQLEASAGGGGGPSVPGLYHHYSQMRANLCG